MTMDKRRQTGRPHDSCYEHVFVGRMSALELIGCLKLEQAGAVMSEFYYGNSKRQKKYGAKVGDRNGPAVIDRISSQGVRWGSISKT